MSDHYLETVSYDQGRVTARCGCGKTFASKQDEDETEAVQKLEQHVAKVKEASDGGH